MAEVVVEPSPRIRGQAGAGEPLPVHRRIVVVAQGPLIEVKPFNHNIYIAVLELLDGVDVQRRLRTARRRAQQTRGRQGDQRHQRREWAEHGAK